MQAIQFQGAGGAKAGKKPVEGQQEKKERQQETTYLPSYVKQRIMGYRQIQKLIKTSPESYQSEIRQAECVAQFESEKRTHKTEIKFKIHYYTSAGEKIIIAGGNEFLGEWQPLRGLQMDYKGEGYWETVLRLYRAEDFEYKYVCVSEHGTCRWELGPNRVFSVKTNVCKIKNQNFLYELKED